jgi:arylsulfatase B
LPERLDTLGYTTRAIVGKWYLGHTRRAYHPLRHGFTSSYGCYNGRVDYFTQVVVGQRDWLRDFGPLQDRGYTTELITDEAVRIIAGATRDKDSPFFLFVSYTTPHQPNQPRAQDEQANKHIVGEKRRGHAGLVSGLDEGVGKIREALTQNGITDSTLVVFLSDNGGALNYGASNAPLRGTKGRAFDGGIRVPAAVFWPDGGLVGEKIVAEPVSHIDIAPTVIAAAGGVELDTMDGINLVPLLTEREIWPDRTIDSMIGRRPEWAAAITRDWKYLEIKAARAPGGAYKLLYHMPAARRIPTS